MRLTVAVIVLSTATALVAGAVAVGGGRLVAASAVVALLCGWAGLRIMWSVVLQARHEHSADRAELARTYRQLFAERAVENHVHTKAMAARMRERDRVIRELETTVVDTRRRAVVAEATVKRVQRRLAEAGGRIITLEEYLARSQAEHRAAVARLEAAEAEARAVASAGSRRRTVVPEWADLETDPTAALMAWEEHAQHHARGAKHAVGRPDSQARLEGVGAARRRLSKAARRIPKVSRLSSHFPILLHFPISSGASRRMYAPGSARRDWEVSRVRWSTRELPIPGIGLRRRPPAQSS